jgi:vacuolar-type H+-ATPase subunit H
MNPDVGVLEEIRKTEEECYRRLEGAKQDVERILLDAKKEGEELLMRSEEEAKHAAEEYYRTELAQIQVEVEAIRMRGEEEIASVRALGERNLPRSVKKIVDTVAFE